MLGRSIHEPVFLENRRERRGLSEARGPAGLSIRISAFFSSSPQICRVRHLQQGISSNPYSCVCIHVVGKHRPGRANSKHVLHGETPTPSGQVCQSTSPGTLWQEPVSWPSLLSCAAVSLVVSAHVPVFRARHFPLGVSEHCSLGVPGYCYLGVPTAEQHPREWSDLRASSSTSSNSSIPEEFKEFLVALAGAPRGTIPRRGHCKHHVALRQLTYGSPSLHFSVEVKRKPESGTVV